MKEDKDIVELIVLSEVEECNTYTEVYWKIQALEKKRFWLYPWSWRLVRFGCDEYWRHTVVVGPLVIALWKTPEGRLIHKRLEEKFNLMMKNDLLK